MMFRYLGEKDGTFTIQAKDGATSSTASCKSPCEFIKVRTYFSGELMKTETVRASGTSIMDAVLQDAQNGLLKPFGDPTRKTSAVATPTQFTQEATTTQDMAPTAVQQTIQPSFDCNKARSQSETLICGDSALAVLDNELAGLYAKAKLAASNQIAFKNDMRMAWNWRETNCEDKQCLIGWYADRKQALMSIINNPA
jgi:hypothetical protein